MNINLHIERLVLDGLPVAPSQGAQVQALVERELARLLAQDGISKQLQSGLALHRVGAEEILSSQGVGIQTIGRQIAGAIHSSISGAATTESPGSNSLGSRL